ncbi:MAG: DUF4132 domain-containing protein [Chitinophagaceae bacterium]
MGLFDKIKSIFTDSTANDHADEFKQAVTDAWRQYAIKHEMFWAPNLNQTTAWTDNVKNWPDKKKIAFTVWLVKSIHEYNEGKQFFSFQDKEDQKNRVRLAYLPTLFRSKLIMDDEDALLLNAAFSQHKPSNWSHFTKWPISLMLNQLERQRKGQVITPALKSMLAELKKDINAVQSYYHEKERIKMMEKIDALLFSAENELSAIKPVKLLGEDPFAEFANEMLQSLPEPERTSWYKLLPLVQKASGSKPSKKYLEETKNIIKELGADKFKKTIHEWFQFLINLKERVEQHSSTLSGQTYTFASYYYITSVNTEAVKGLIWACSHFHDQATIQTITALAERAFRKIPGQGPTALAIGNACLYFLYKSKGLDGIGQLSRLKLRIKQSSTQALIDKYLQAAAEEQGVTVSEVEDMAVDDGGLVNGTRSFVFDDYKAELVIASTGKTEQKWFKPDGTPQKSVPATVKEQHATKLKKLKVIAKQVEQTLVAQRDRIDRMFRDDRKISWNDFEKYYLRHGLMSYLANGIIWNFHQQETTKQAIHINNQWVNAENELVKIDNTDTVSLWHPVQATVLEIKAWRDFLIFHQIQQPLKQAFREVYLLTDAEVNTRTYSNRMAAHILRQHQFNSLAKARGWRYSLMGSFDNGTDNGTASLLLVKHSLRAEYWISEVNADGAMNNTGIWNYVSTDQVRFINTDTNESVDLIYIHPLVFSEVMRDVDLFVGVSSVGNDPGWRDGGGLPAYRDYWTSYSFGELSEVAKNRKEVLTNLIPRLKIKNIATIKDKFLVVKGKLRTYKIHIGSTNILMEPNDQYLCIVPDRNSKDHTENLYLPFEGDSGLSVIISKAFLLAEDDKIKDSTIISQINRK